MKHLILTCLRMNTPRRLEQVIDTCGYINVDTRVQISQHEGLDGHICLLDLLLDLPLVISVFKHGPQVLRQSRMLLIVHICGQALNFVRPGESDFRFEFVVLGARQEAQHFFTVMLDSKQVMIANDNLHELLAEVLVGFTKARMQWVFKLQAIRILVPYTNVAVLNDCIAHIVSHRSSFFVAHPSVNTSTT